MCIRDSVDTVVSDKDVVDNKDKKVDNSKDNLINENKVCLLYTSRCV